MTSSLLIAEPATGQSVPPAVGVSRFRMWLGMVALAAVGLVGATPFLLPVLRQMLAGRTLPVSIGTILALQDVQNLVLAACAAAIGVWTGPPVGLDAPLLRARLAGERVARRVLRLLPTSVLAGTLGSAAVLLITLALKSHMPEQSGGLPDVSPWVGATGAFYGGLVEEILLRWGFLSLLAFGLDRVGMGRTSGFWVANVVSALVFGLSHFPAARALGMPFTPAVVCYLLAGNGVVGLICGWLFRRRGLESAMLAHATADLWLHAVFPALGL